MVASTDTLLSCRDSSGAVRLQRVQNAADRKDRDFTRAGDLRRALCKEETGRISDRLSHHRRAASNVGRVQC
jgi:hypothetical protein